MAGTSSAWTRARVWTLAPDAASLQAAERLASPGTWSGHGHLDDVLWGACRGSAAAPYQAMADLSGPAFRCSCPSRKSPCKHVLALLLLWVDGQVPVQDPAPEGVTSWVASQGSPAAPRTRRVAAADPEVAAQQAAQRAARRVDRVRLGLEELDVWLADQVRGGLAALQRGGYGPVDQVAARMVDAQAPGVAGMLRALPARYVGEGWPGRTLEHLAQIRLLVAAHRRLDDLPADLADTVRSRVGYPTAKESVLTRPPVRDQWAVLGMVEVPDYQLTTRRVWLRGTATGRWAVLVSYAAGGAAPDSPVLPGVTVDADIHFYPGAGQHRGLLGTEHARAGSVADVPGEPVVRAAELFGELVALDPWAERMPVVLAGAPVPPDDEAGRWRFRDEQGGCVLLVAGVEAWPLLARSMGDPVDVFGEWTRDGFLPLAFLPHPLDPVFSLEVLVG